MQMQLSLYLFIIAATGHKTAERVIGSNLPSVDAIYTQRCRRKAQSILRDKHHHPAYALFKWVDTGYNLRHRRPASISTHKACLFNSFSSATFRLVAQDIKEGKRYL